MLCDLLVRSYNTRLDASWVSSGCIIQGKSNGCCPCVPWSTKGSERYSISTLLKLRILRSARTTLCSSGARATDSGFERWTCFGVDAVSALVYLSGHRFVLSWWLIIIFFFSIYSSPHTRSPHTNVLVPVNPAQVGGYPPEWLRRPILWLRILL